MLIRLHAVIEICSAKESTHLQAGKYRDISLLLEHAFAHCAQAVIAHAINAACALLELKDPQLSHLLGVCCIYEGGQAPIECQAACGLACVNFKTRTNDKSILQRSITGHQYHIAHAQHSSKRFTADRFRLVV